MRDPLDLKTIQALTEDERKFLHDIANPLSVAMFATETVIETMGPQASPENIARAKKVYESLEKIRDKLNARREILKARVP